MVGVLLCFFVVFHIGGFVVIKSINDLTLENLHKEINILKKDLKNSKLELENMYIYVSYNEPVYGKKSSTIKESINTKGLEKIIQELNKLNRNSNINFLSFGIEYQGDDPLGGAKDLLIVKRDV